LGGALIEKNDQNDGKEIIAQMARRLISFAVTQEKEIIEMTRIVGVAAVFTLIAGYVGAIAALL
jgi:hypothetical protein